MDGTSIRQRARPLSVAIMALACVVSLHWPGASEPCVDKVTRCVYVVLFTGMLVCARVCVCVSVCVNQCDVCVCDVCVYVCERESTSGPVCMCMRVNRYLRERGRASASRAAAGWLFLFALNSCPGKGRDATTGCCDCAWLFQ